MHGKPKKPTWTQLNKTAPKGATKLTLKESVNWEVGDKIVVASSSHSFDEAEELTIVDIEDDGLVIEVDSALQYEHFGELLSYEGHQIDMRWVLRESSTFSMKKEAK